MRSVRQVWASAGSLVFLALLLLSGMVVAQEVVIVQLDSVGGSGVTGTATLMADGDGTKVVLDVTGLPPGADARSTIHAGTCAMPSASFAVLPDLKADAAGRATASGSVLFRGIENIALATMADADHIVILQTEEVVAWGVIPKLTSAPAQLPVTGRAASPLGAIGVGVIGLCALSVGSWHLYRQHSCGWLDH